MTSLLLVVILAVFPKITYADLFIGSKQITLPANGNYTYENNIGENGSTWWVFNNNGSFTLTLNGANITETSLNTIMLYIVL